MVSSSLLVSLLALHVVQGEDVSVDLPPIGGCDSGIISIIKTYWSLFGVPYNLMKTMEEASPLTFLSTTFNLDPNSPTKCVFLNATNSQMVFSFVPKDGSANKLLKYDMKEEGPILTTEGGNTLLYAITNINHVLAYYVCNTKGDPRQAPLVTILLDSRYINNPVTKSLSNSMSSLLTYATGKAIPYQYANDCF